jgi:hypothetical protein
MSTLEVSVNQDEIESLMSELEGLTETGNAATAAAAKIPEKPVVEEGVNPAQAAANAALEERLAEQEKVNADSAFSPDELAESLELDDIDKRRRAEPVVEAPPTVTPSAAVAAARKALAAVPSEPPAAAAPVAVEPETPEDPIPAPAPVKAAELDFYIDVDEFRRDTAISEVNLDDQMMKQAGLRAYYGAQAARAEAQAGRVKARFEVVEATLYNHHRKELNKSAEKVTEKAIENAVKLDPRWIKAKNTVIEAESIASINKSLVFSLQDRRDMIIQLGADRRDEMKGAARVMAAQDERDALRKRAVNAAGQASNN